jgi:hypothetical protein
MQNKIIALERLLTQLETHFEDYKKSNPTVSQVAVGWHIDHTLLAFNSIVTALKKSNPANYKWQFNLNRFFVKDVLGKIPRGKGKAPKTVTPVDETNLEKLKENLLKAREGIIDLETLNANSYFPHPYFGNLKLKTALWFLKTHTKHHLKIIEDICK